MRRLVMLLVAAALVPGLGHALLGSRRRGAMLFAIVCVTFVVGLRVDGRLVRVDSEHPLTALGAIAVGATGVLNLAARALGLGVGDPASATYDYGTTYLLSAGLMNLLLLLDVHRQESLRTEQAAS